MIINPYRFAGGGGGGSGIELIAVDFLQRNVSVDFVNVSPQSGDLLLAVGMGDFNVEPLAGFTTVSLKDNFFIGHYVGYKVSDGTETASDAALDDSATEVTAVLQLRGATSTVVEEYEEYGNDLTYGEITLGSGTYFLLLKFDIDDINIPTTQPITYPAWATRIGEGSPSTGGRGTLALAYAIVTGPGTFGGGDVTPSANDTWRKSLISVLEA